jgi:hypothetical protein
MLLDGRQSQSPLLNSFHVVAAFTQSLSDLVPESLTRSAAIEWAVFSSEEPTGPAFGRLDDKLRDEVIQSALRRFLDCFGEPVIGRAFARPGGSQ